MVGATGETFENIITALVNGVVHCFPLNRRPLENTRCAENRGLGVTLCMQKRLAFFKSETTHKVSLRKTFRRFFYRDFSSCSNCTASRYQRVRKLFPRRYSVFMNKCISIFVSFMNTRTNKIKSTR